MVPIVGELLANLMNSDLKKAKNILIVMGIQY